MRAFLAVTLLSLAGVLAITTFANGQTTLVVRVLPVQVTANTTPARDRTRPYTFTTTGRVVPPAACVPGVGPMAAANCLPPICRSGTPGGAIYCVPTPGLLACSGKVSVRFRKVTTTISVRVVDVRPDCTYRSRVSFRLRSRERRGLLRVQTRFEGNLVLLARRSSRQTVRAG